MHDFEPEDMTHFVVNGNSAVTFYEYISHETPTQVKGAYYTQGTDQKVNVFV
jgi:hypothetical protein